MRKKYTIIILPNAHNDLQQAVDYYNALQEGLGDKFYFEFDENLAHLSENPFYQIIYKHYRGLVIKKFPFYKIIFSVNEDNYTIKIISIFHTSQNPDKKPK